MPLLSRNGVNEEVRTQLVHVLVRCLLRRLLLHRIHNEGAVHDLALPLGRRDLVHKAPGPPHVEDHEYDRG